MRRVIEKARRLVHDERGVFLPLFGLLAIVLIATSGAVVDYTTVEQARSRAQVALDAASLALQPRIYTESEDALKAMAEALLIERIDDPSITANVLSATKNTTDGSLRLTARVTVPLVFVSLVGIDTMSAQLTATATRGALDLEISVSLDTTNSMSGSRIENLKDAMEALIPLVIKDTQSPTYSKMAIVPYSMGVNVGSYAASARGAIPPAKSITGVAWMNGTSKNINGITRANPAVVTTSAAHGYTTGNFVYISGVTGMTQVNNKIYKVVSVSSTQFSLQTVAGTNINSSSYSNYSGSSGDTSQRCHVSTCELVVTSTTHGFVTNDYVYVTGVGGTTQINNVMFQVTKQTDNTYSLNGQTGFNNTFGTYTSGGSGWCTKYGCQYYRFTNPSGSVKLHQVSTCVSERTTDAYTDVSPATTPMGHNYPSTSNPCISQQIVPLTSNKATLNAAVSLLSASGSTAGHVGIGWAWYLISPHFASLFPAASKPAAYDAPHLLKVLILMTDGEYNSSYCNGVIAKSSTTGSGSTNDHINCDAPNGSSWSQSGELCNSIKASGVTVYTVGFDVDSAPNAATLMLNCATDASHAYTPDTGAELVDVFEEIGRNISALRLVE